MDNTSAELRYDDLVDISQFDEADGGNILSNETGDISKQCALQASCSQRDTETALLHGEKQASTEKGNDPAQRTISEESSMSRPSGFPFQSIPSTQPASKASSNTLHTPTLQGIPSTQPAAANTLHALAPHPSQLGPVMRVKVRINDKLFLVPIPTEGSLSKTIGWLCDEAADRYYKSYNLQLKLSLYTQDGALLSPADLVVMVLTHNEEV